MRFRELRKRIRKLYAFLPQVIAHRLWLNSPFRTNAIREKILREFQESGRGFPNSLGEGAALQPVVFGTGRRQGTARFFVLLSTVGHFGNLTIQLANSVALARLAGSETVFFSDSALGQGRWRPELRAFDIRALRGEIGVNLDLREITSDDVQNFNGGDTLWKCNAMKDQEVFLDLKSEDAKLLRSSIVNALGPLTIPRRSETTATIHLRSGDIFGHNPHPRYGQPPWSFYESVLEQGGIWSEIRLVAEDFSNPVHSRISDWAQSRGIPVVNSGATFISAVEEIASASNLLASNSTFLPAVTFLFPHSRTTYFFGTKPHRMMTASAGTLIGVKDTRGIYHEQVLRRNWINSDGQRNLMMSYPAANLEFVTVDLEGKDE